MDSSKKLATSMRRLFLKFRSPSQAKELDTAPGCPFGVVVEERLKNMERSLQEVKGRINGLIFAVMAAVAAEVILRLLG